MATGLIFLALTCDPGSQALAQDVPIPVMEFTVTPSDTVMVHASGLGDPGLIRDLVMDEITVRYPRAAVDITDEKVFQGYYSLDAAIIKAAPGRPAPMRTWGLLLLDGIPDDGPRGEIKVVKGVGFMAPDLGHPLASLADLDAQRLEIGGSFSALARMSGDNAIIQVRIRRHQEASEPGTIMESTMGSPTAGAIRARIAGMLAGPPPDPHPIQEVCAILTANPPIPDGSRRFPWSQSLFNDLRLASFRSPGLTVERGSDGMIVTRGNCSPA